MVDDSDPPVLDVDDLIATRQAERTRVILRTMLVLEVVVVALAFLDARNDPIVTAAVHGPSFSVLGVGLWLHGRGRARLAGWIASTTFWLVVAGSTWFFGGLRFEMGTAFVVAVMVAAATLGSRPALGFGGASIAWASVVTVADVSGHLPPSLAPESPTNSWISLAISIGIAAILVHVIMRDMKQAVVQEARATSERDAARIRLLEAQRMEPVGRLAGGVAHDFNNLLTVMTSVAAMLRDVDDEGERAMLLDELDAAAMRASQMTSQLLAFSRRREGKPRVFDLARVVAELAPVLSRLIGDAIDLDVETMDDVAPVRAAPGQLEQVVLNLAVNARDAMPQGGRLVLRCERDDENICLVVEDTGVGMSPETAQSAFSPFFTTKPSGTGIGLATVADIIEACGGAIALDSEPGKGTRFVIRLPEQARDSLVESGAIRRARPTTPGRILLVDDDDLVRRTTRRLLEHGGFEVTAVADGLEALSLIESQGEEGGFDLVVSDMMMPRMGGHALVDELAERCFERPVVLISGNVDVKPASLDRVGFPIAFLPKPFTADDLLSMVRDSIATSRRRGGLPSGRPGAASA